MQDETAEELSLPLPTATRQLVENWCAHLGTVSRALNEHYGIAPNAGRVEELDVVIGEMRNLLELSDEVSEESANGAQMVRPEANGQNESWRGQESGRSDNVPGRSGQRDGAEYRLLAKAKAQAKAAFRQGRRTRKRRRKVRR